VENQDRDDDDQDISEASLDDKQKLKFYSALNYPAEGNHLNKLVDHLLEMPLYIHS